MRTKLYVILICFISSGLVAFTNDILQDLALTEKETNNAIKDNFIHGSLLVPDNKTIRGIAIAKRSATVHALGQYIKTYIQSPQFATAYEETRKANAPAGRADMATLKKLRLERIEEEMAEMESKLKNATGSNQQLLQLSLNQLKQEREALKNPRHPMHQDYVSNLTEEEDANVAQSHNALQGFTEQYPPTVKALIMKRLREFLVLTANINFSAKLVQEGNKKVFADPALEARDGNWKKCFRAGPETISAARHFAQQWLQELETNK